MKIILLWSFLIFPIVHFQSNKFCFSAKSILFLLVFFCLSSIIENLLWDIQCFKSFKVLIFFYFFPFTFYFALASEEIPKKKKKKLYKYFSILNIWVFTKLIKIGFSMEWYAGDVLRFSGKTLQIYLIGGLLGTQHQFQSFQ